MKSALVISGWAHGIEAIRPLGEALSDGFDVQLLTGAQLLAERRMPAAECIVTGSMGGLLAMELLPATCRKLVLISSTARFCATDGYPCGTQERILQRMIHQLQRHPEAVLEEFYRNVHFPHPAPECDPGAPLEALAAGLEYLRDADLRVKVPSIGIPVLLMHGTRDRIIPAAAAEWLHARLPDSQLQLYDDGHALPAHRFEELAGAIRAFLNPAPRPAND